jgi:glycosyltransferase involved in cell wall biosynthesis
MPTKSPEDGEHPRISVVTPTKNRIKLLKITMDSVAQQSLANWEHIIVDDGSDDVTCEEIRRRQESDPRIRFLPRMGLKPGANVCRNQGVAAARSDLIVFLDSDDLLEPDCLSARVAFMQRNQDIDFAASRTGVFATNPGDLFRELDGAMIGDDLLRFLYFETPWQTTATTWRREALACLGGWDESLPSWQDIDLHVRALALGMRYLRVPIIDHHMRWTDDPERTSSRQRRDHDHLRAAGPLIEKFEDLISNGPGMNWVRRRALCSLYFFVSERFLETGDTRQAIHFWRRICHRELGSYGLYLVGSILLRLLATRSPVRKPTAQLCHKWKGWARLRTNPELVATGQKKVHA